MGCVCCSLSSFVSILLNALERISLCTVCALLVCCLVFTLVTMMVMGIGIGYHYCTVQNSVAAMEKAAKAAGTLRSGNQPERPYMRSVNRAVKRGFAHRMGRRELDAAMPSNNNTVNDAFLANNITAINTTHFIAIPNKTMHFEASLHGQKTIRYKRDLTRHLSSSDGANDSSILDDNSMWNNTVNNTDYDMNEVEGNTTRYANNTFKDSVFSIVNFMLLT